MTQTTQPQQPKRTILLLNGPNLNLLGTREPTIYGSATLSTITSTCSTLAATYSLKLTSFQSNHEGALIDRIHAARDEDIGAIVINPGAYTHTSVAIRDALIGVGIPFVEVHISNVHAREEFRKRSYLSDVAEGVVCGLGVFGYEVGVEFCARVVLGREKEKGV